MNTNVISREFRDGEVLRLELIQMTDEVLCPTPEERKLCMSKVFQTLNELHADNMINDAELQFATDLWLDKYSLLGEPAPDWLRVEKATTRP